MSSFSSGATATTALLNQKTLFVGTNAPSNPANGQLWYDTTNKGLKEWHSDTSSWIRLGALPAQFKLTSDFTTSSLSFVDTGIVLTTSGASIVVGTFQIVMSGTGSNAQLRLSVAGASTFYVFQSVRDGTFTSGNNTDTSFNTDLILSNPANPNTRDVILIAYVSAAATIKIQAQGQGSGTESITVKTNSSLVACPS